MRVTSPDETTWEAGVHVDAGTPGSRVRLGEPGGRVGGFIHGLGEVLLTLAAFVLLFCVYEVYGTNVYTHTQQARLGDQLRKSWAAAPGPDVVSADTPPDALSEDGAAPGDARGRTGTNTPQGTRAPALEGTGFAIISIPVIGMRGSDAHVVVEGVGREDLKEGPGHYPGTALPGSVGNVVISGHRTTYGAPFERLDELSRGDAIVLETRKGWYTYTVSGEEVVAPDAVEVTYPVPGHAGEAPTKRLLTLTTCNPKYSARQRLVVHAELASFTPHSAGAPRSLGTGG